MFPHKTRIALILAVVAVSATATPLLGQETQYFGLWSLSPSDAGDGDLFLYRAALRYHARSALRAAGILPDVFRVKEDSLGLRSDRFDDFLVLQDSVGLGWMPPVWIRPRSRNDVTRQVTVDLDSSKVEEATLLQGKPISRPFKIGMADYLDTMTRRNYRSIWKSKAEQGLLSIEKNPGGSGGLVNIPIPVPVPSALRGLVGEGKPNLQVRGSERITFAGTSRWYPDQPVTEFQQKQSKFPQLEMKQELNLQLTGNIGNKVSVDVDQSSQATTPLSNNIKIHYKGYRDEIVQKVDLGNTSLSLPGTQYVTYSGQQQGLFGINAQALVGDVEVTGILSKQQGKNDTRTLTKGAEIRTFTIEDYQYKQGKFFFLTDPDGGSMTDAPYPNGVGALVDGSVEVWVDDRNGYNNLEQGTTPAYVTLDGRVRSVRDSIGAGHAATGDFSRLTIGDDYTIQNDVYTGYPVLILNDTQVLDNQMTKAMAVRYRTSHPADDPGGNLGTNPDTLVLKLIRPAAAMGGTRPTDLTQGIFAAAAKLELRNVYDLGSNLSPEGLVVRIRRKTTIGGITNPDQAVDPTDPAKSYTFLQILGLDFYTESGESRSLGSDGKIDRGRISYDSGYVMFRELQPFAPTPDDSLRRMGAPDPARPTMILDRAPEIYRRDYWTEYDANQVSKYQFEVTAKSAVSTIVLNAFNLLQGSEVVTAGGRTLVRDHDYTIDYDTGEIQILDAADVRDTDEIRVSYSYVPFGAGAQKTLMGTAFRFRPQSSKLGLSTTWIYEGRGAPGTEGLRPRLGQEPTRTVVGELAASYKSDSWLLTSLVNALPGVKTDQKSSFSVDAGVGLSFPNPNTRNQLYVDDFEGAKDVFEVQMNRTAWKPSGIPVNAPGTTDAGKLEHRGECWWYSPRSAVKEGDLQPTQYSKGGLADTEKDNNRSILELHYFPRGFDDATRDSSWCSLVQPLSQRGTDLSRAQFLDVWVNDFIPYDHQAQRKGKIHVDIGVVSENAIWQKVVPDDQPGHLYDPQFHYDAHQLVSGQDGFDTEDVNHDGQLDVPSSGAGEDTGLDRKSDQQEAGYDPSGNPDPADDNYSFQEGKDEGIRELGGIDQQGVAERLGIYSKINGTEKNGRLDTEDLNGNQILDTDESYFAFTINLHDTTNVEFESGRAPYQDAKYAGYTRGWRRIRIPLTADNYTARNSPAWDQIRHMRIWLDGFDKETRVQIGGIEVTGNRWLAGPIRPSHPDSSFSLAPGEDFFPAVLNNKDNSTSEYTPPPISLKTTQNVQEREQSLTLEMRNFQPNHVGVVYRTFATPQDFASLYKTLEFYTNRRIREGPTPDSLLLFVRFSRNAATEEQNYYEYEAPIEDGWALRRIDLAEMSRIPVRADTLRTSQWIPGNVVITRKGNPSLTSVQRITFGLINKGQTPIESGDVWIDELRLGSVKRDTGKATRLAFSANLADLGNVNLNYQQQDADFLRIGSDRGSGTTQTGIAASTRMNLDRFVGGTGLKIPVSYSVNMSRQVPKFRTNSDLVLKTATDRDITESQTKDFSFNAQRNRSSNPLLRYTIDAVSLSGRLGSSISDTPDSRDTTLTRSGSVQYTLPIQGGPPIRIYKNTTLHLLPTSLSMNVTGSQQKEKEFRRRNGDLNQPYDPSRDLTTRNGSMTWSTGLRPIDAINYTFDQGRDLRLGTAPGRLMGLRIGTEISRRHQLTANQQVPMLNGAFTPKVAWTGSFDGRFNSLQTGSAVNERSNNFSNSNTLTFSGSIPLDRIMRRIVTIGAGRGRDEGAGKDHILRDVGDNGSPDMGNPGEPPDTSGVPPEIPPIEPRGSADGGGGRGGGEAFLNVFSVGGIAASYTINSTSSLGLISGNPSIPYQLGLTRNTGGGLRRLRSIEGGTISPNSSSGDRRDLNLSTEVKVLSEIRIGMTYQQGYQSSSSNGGGSTNRSRRFPDLDINWGRIHRKLGIDKFAKDLRASTRYTREVHETGTSTVPKDRKETTVSLRPLLSIDATLNNGVTTKLTSSYSSSRMEQFGITHSLTLTRSRAVQLNMRRTLNLSRMVTNPLTKKKSKVTSKLDLSVSLDLSDDVRRSGPIGSLVVLEDRAKYALSTTGGYNITQNVTGNAGLSFGQDSDRKNKTRTARYVSVSVSAAFNF